MLEILYPRQPSPRLAVSMPLLLRSGQLWAQCRSNECDHTARSSLQSWCIADNYTQSPIHNQFRANNSEGQFYATESLERQRPSAYGCFNCLPYRSEYHLSCTYLIGSREFMMPRRALSVSGWWTTRQFCVLA